MKKSLALLASTILFSVSAQAAKEWQVIEAVYEVPAPAELEPYAHFKIQDLLWRERGDVVEMKYTLPLELTGRPIEIHVERNASGDDSYAGDIGKMDCKTATACEMRYPNLKVDADSVRSFLEAQGIQGAELDARMDVLTLFIEGDPAGILRMQSGLRIREASSVSY